jgi:hypothetical protein
MNLSLSLGTGGTGGFTVLSEDGERVLCRGWRDDGGGDRKAVLAVLSGSEHPTPGFINRLAHEYGLRNELDGRSAVRPLALVREHGRTVLLLEDPGGEPFDRLLGSLWRQEGSCASPPTYRRRFASYTNVVSSIRTSSRPMCSLTSRPAKSG